MKLGAKGYLGLFKTAAMDWMDDKAPRLGAALAFYTIFSLAPLLTVVITIASLWYTENADQQIYSHMASVIGQEKAAELGEMLTQQGEKKQGVFTAISAGVMLQPCLSLLSACGRVRIRLRRGPCRAAPVKPVFDRPIGPAGAFRRS